MERKRNLKRAQNCGRDPPFFKLRASSVHWICQNCSYQRTVFSTNMQLVHHFYFFLLCLVRNLMPMLEVGLTTTQFVATELNSSKTIAGKELSLSSSCIASLYIYRFLTVIDFLSEKYSGSTGHRNSWYQQRNLP